MSIARDISRQSSIQTSTLTANQSGITVAGGFSGSNLEVYLNGAKIIQGQDYTLNGTSGIILTQGASADDIIASQNSSELTENAVDTEADNGDIV